VRRDLELALQNLRSYGTRLRGLAILIVLACVFGLTAAAVVAEAGTVSHHQVAEADAIRSIAVRAQPERPDLRKLTHTALAGLSKVPGVDSVEPWLQASFAFKDRSGVAALLYGTAPQAHALPPVVRSVRASAFPLRPGEAVIPQASAGVDLSVLLGKRIVVSYTRKVGEGAGEAVSDSITVVGLYDQKYQEDGPDAAYVDSASVVRWAAGRAGIPPSDYLEADGYRQATVLASRADQVSSVLAEVRRQGFDAVSLAAHLHELPQTMKLLKWLAVAVTGALILYTLIAGFTVSSGFVRQRTHEIGLLKAVGFARVRVLRIFLLELTAIGIGSAACGVVLGNVVGLGAAIGLRGRSFLGVTMPDGLSIPSPSWSLALLIGPAAACVVGGVLPARRAAALAPDEALRDW
jgi:putative ABC transport system permease protein